MARPSTEMQGFKTYGNGLFDGADTPLLSRPMDVPATPAAREWDPGFDYSVPHTVGEYKLQGFGSLAAQMMADMNSMRSKKGVEAALPKAVFPNAPDPIPAPVSVSAPVPKPVVPNTGVDAALPAAVFPNTAAGKSGPEFPALRKWGGENDTTFADLKKGIVTPSDWNTPGKFLRRMDSVSVDAQGAGIKAFNKATGNVVRDFVEAQVEPLLNDPAFIKTAKSAAMHFLHVVMIVKGVITACILAAAIYVCVMYQRTDDPIAKQRLLFNAGLWIGQQSGVVGTIVFLWLPTLVFFLGMRLAQG